MVSSDGVDHHLSDAESNVHTAWNRDLEPVATVASGDVVRFDCLDSMGGRITEGMTATEAMAVESVGHHLTGPVAVDGARPGDVLQVDLLDVEHGGWGYTYFTPGEDGSGIIPEAFTDPGLYFWDLDEDVGEFVDGIEVPLDPFPGVVGVAPADPGPHSTTPPRAVGGNLDVKHLTEGSTLYLPVAVEDALFSIGDGHAAQGDGEVCVTAIETPMTVTARLTVRRDLDLDAPQFRTAHPFTPSGRDESMYGTTGIADDVFEAARQATRRMVEHVHEHRGLTRGEAYLLCSVAMDLKVNELVNEPHWVVSGYLPDSIFPE